MAGPPFDIDESQPADTGIVSQFPADERSNRDIIESWLAVDHDTSGEHKQSVYPELGADPASQSNKGIVYTKDVSALTELFYRDSAGTIIQLTKAGQPAGAIPAGTTMFFGQAAAPTGWTQNVTWNDRVLRVVSGAGAGTSGSWTISGLDADSHVLTITEMPSHTHGLGSHGADDDGIDRISVKSTTAPRSPTSGNLSNTGGGAGHPHTISSDGTWRPAVLDVIAADKD